MALNDVINAAKKRKGMTNNDLAEITGFTLSNIDKITSGNNSNPKLGTLQAICKALDLTLDDLVEPSHQEIKTPAPEGPEAGEKVSIEELTDFLERAGYIQKGGDLSDADFQFLAHLIGLIDLWCQNRQGGE